MPANVSSQFAQFGAFGIAQSFVTWFTGLAFLIVFGAVLGAQTTPCGVDRSPDSTDGPGVKTPAAWPKATVLTGRRLVLEPLRTDHADEMAAVLDDPALYEYTGGAPATAAELRARYSRLEAGLSADGSEGWLNWVVRHGADAVGFVQATVTRSSDQFDAEVAWVIGSGRQHHGFATEAALLMVEWLRRQGASSIVAHIHPGHVASAAVARRIGLLPTDHIEDGEIRWVKSFPA